MARMACSDEVLAKHVKEAFTLLNKSIIRVDQPDIHLEEEEADNVEEMEVDGADENVAPNQQNLPEPASQQGPRKRMKLSYEKYRNISNMLIIHMRQQEARLEA